MIETFLRGYAGGQARDVAPWIVGTRVLDLGAGEGFVAERLRRPGRLVCGVDVGGFRRAPIPYAVYDGARLPLADAGVDTTLLLLVLHHCQRPEAVLDEALRVTRHRLIVTESVYRNDLDLCWLRLLDPRVNRLRHGGRMPPPTGFRRARDWQALFVSRGWRPVTTRWLGSRLERLVHHPHLWVLTAAQADDVVGPGGAGR